MKIKWHHPVIFPPYHRHFSPIIIHWYQRCRLQLFFVSLVYICSYSGKFAPWEVVFVLWSSMYRHKTQNVMIEGWNQWISEVFYNFKSHWLSVCSDLTHLWVCVCVCVCDWPSCSTAVSWDSSGQSGRKNKRKKMEVSEEDHKKETNRAAGNRRE